MPLPVKGFTIVLGNPPWEIIKPDLREYYAQFDARVESQLNRAAAETRIAELDAADAARPATFAALSKAAEETSAYTRRRGSEYTRQGRGDTATHKLFTERMWALLQTGGRLGYVIPSGVYTDLGTKELRQMLLDEGHIQTLIGLSNVRSFFPEVDSRFKFTLLSAAKGEQRDDFLAAFRIDLRVGVHPKELPAFVANPNNFIRINREMIARFSPDSLSLMEFQTAQDYAIAEKIYADHPLMGQEVAGAWNVKYTREFDMTNDRHLFRSASQAAQGAAGVDAWAQNVAGGEVGAQYIAPLRPLYEGKMFHQYDAFFAPPTYVIQEEEGRKAILGRRADTGQTLDYQRPRLVFRDIARGTDERTLIAAVLPANVFCNNKAPTLTLKEYDAATMLFFSGLMNSFVEDWVIRQKVSTTLNWFYVASLPLPRLAPGNRFFDAIVPRAARLVCTRPAFAALWQEVMGTAWEDPALTPQPPPVRGRFLI
jgi:hypothetical protein